MSADDYATLLKHLAKIDHIQQLPDGNLILGLAGEKVVRSRDFYAVFESAEELEVRHGERVLGRISAASGLEPGMCLRLAGEMWEIKVIVVAQKEVLVVQAKEARQMLFEGSGAPELHSRVAQKVREILLGEAVPRYLSPPGQAALVEARRLYKKLPEGSEPSGSSRVILPWTGTRAAQTLKAMLEQTGLEVEFPFFPWIMQVNGGLPSALRQLQDSPPTAADLAASLPLAEIRTHKFDEFLPEPLLRARAAEEWLDVNGALMAIATLR